MSEIPLAGPRGVPEWTLGWRLQRSLAYAGMTSEQMADELGMSRTSVSRWLNDRAIPRNAYLKVWAIRTGVPYLWLRDGKMPPPPGTGPGVRSSATCPSPFSATSRTLRVVAA